jgi:hypothetical protein
MKVGTLNAATARPVPEAGNCTSRSGYPSPPLRGPRRGDRARAVGVANRAKPLADLANRQVPADPLETRFAPVQRVQEPLGVVHVIRHAHPLDADVPPGNGVILIGSNGGNAVPFDVDLEPTKGLAGADLAGGPMRRHGAIPRFDCRPPACTL